MKEKQEDFFEKIHKNMFGRVMFFIVSMTMMIVLYMGLSMYISKYNYEKNIRETKIVKDYNILMSIDEFLEEDKKMIFSGWSMRLYSRTLDVCLVLKEVDGIDEIVLTTETFERKDIANFFKTEFSNIGFTATIDKKKIEENTTYEIFLFLNYESKEENDYLKEYEKKIAIGRYLCNGEIYSYNPLGYVEPEVENIKVQEVVKKGTILAHDVTSGIWIYKYKEEIYWIVRFELFGQLEQKPEIPLFTYRIFEEDGRTIVKKEYKGIYVNEEDYITYADNDYFVCSIPVIEEENIVYFDTGVYQNRGDNIGWVWNVKYVMNINWMK